MVASGPYCEAPAFRGMPPGQQVWSVIASPTRDGKRYGASLPAHHAASLEEARALVRKLAAGARARYVKAAG